MPFTATTRLTSVITGCERQRRRERRRHDAVEQQARAARDRTRRANRAAAPRCSPRADSRRTAAERRRVAPARARIARRCSLEQRRLGIVGGREVRVDRIELEVLAGQQLRQRPPQVVEPEAEPVHAGVDLQVIAEPLLVARGRRLHGARRARRRDRRRQAAVEQAVEIADAQRAEDEDVGPDAGGAQRGAFLDVGARQQVGAGVLERPRHLRPRRGRRRSP